MGLFGRLRRRGMGDPVRGTAQVVSASAHRGDGVWQNCHMELVISADGMPAQAVSYDGLVHRKRWPFPGMALPVTVDREDPESFTIEWDDLPTSRERAQDSAEALAAMMRGDGAAAGAGAFGAQNVQIVGDVSSLSEAQKAKLRALGVDVDALAGATAPGAAAPAATGDEGAEDDARLARLERLAALHAQGVLTDEELERQKRRILD